MKIVFTGGGTAGHVMPNVALIRRLLSEGWDISYIGSKDGMEKDIIDKIDDVKFYGIHCGKLRRYFDIKNLSDPFRVIKGIREAKKIIKGIEPDAVFSKGGYVSLPVVVAAGKVPVVSHESDYSPGLANRLAEPFCDKVCVTFEDTVPMIKHHKGVFTGTPIRPELYRGNREAGLKFTGLSGEKPILLIMGGSSGALHMNELIRNTLDLLLDTFDIIHLCGKGKVEESFVRPGYIQYAYISEELPDLFAISDVVISRSGANAIFELLALNKPSVLIPLPLSASRGDQILNAKYFERKGYAVMADQDAVKPEELSKMVHEVYENREAFIKNMQQDPCKDGTDEVLKQIKAAVETGKQKKHAKKQ